MTQKEIKEIEERQIEYLEKRREHLINMLVAACEDINDQIKAIKNGYWKAEVIDGSKDQQQERI